VCFALKANSNLAVLETLAREGAGADVVSGGELKRALAAGISPTKIVFSGVGKTREEIRAAIDAGILQLNAESLEELEVISQEATRLNKTAAIAIRINPDIDAGTHHKISTGRKENKFGIDLAHAREAYRRAHNLPGLAPVAVAVHIGSQLTSLQPFAAAFEVVASFVEALRRTGFPIDRVDLGGGLGISYRGETPPAVADYAALARRAFGNLDCHLILEPGRAIAGSAGVLVSRVLFVKTGVARRFVILDAAMNDLMRPSLYDAYHPVLPVLEPAVGEPFEPVDVVGPVCETGDTLAVQRLLPSLTPGELVAITAAGAYGAVMASSYNSRPLVPEVLVSGECFAVVRRRPSIEDILAMENPAPWLKSGSQLSK
jgi:diaminopimelate decarboxylase